MHYHPVEKKKGFNQRTLGYPKFMPECKTPFESRVISVSNGLHVKYIELSFKDIRITVTFAAI